MSLAGRHSEPVENGMLQGGEMMGEPGATLRLVALLTCDRPRLGPTLRGGGSAAV